MKVVIAKCRECGNRHEGDWVDSTAKNLIKHQLCFTCLHWWEVMNLPAEKCVRVNGLHYFIGDGKGVFKGFDGRRFDIEFFDGRKVTTYDLWHQGAIPNHFRDRLPDNARFV